MKTRIKILIVVIIVALIVLATMLTSSNNKDIPNEFCAGFSSGYKSGYCYRKIGCIAPIIPLCPIREVWEKDEYEYGVRRGFIQGLADQK